MSVFEPAVILAILKGLEPNTSKQKVFGAEWEKSVSSGHQIPNFHYSAESKVANRVQHWKKVHLDQEATQLQWEAEVVEYVNYLHCQTRVHANKKEGTAPNLRKAIPLLGPRFVPPSYLHLQKRHVAPIIEPESAYLRPLNIVHPFYYPQIARCPNCKSKDVLWDGWTSRGSREVHGVGCEEAALGFQLRCKPCERAASSERRVTYCTATTNQMFWEQWEHWEIPSQ
jgi:hypothetical protein